MNRSDFPDMREALAPGPGSGRSALVVCAVMCAVVAVLISVSLLVPGPPAAPATPDPATTIQTAVAPTGG